MGPKHILTKFIPPGSIEQPSFLTLFPVSPGTIVPRIAENHIYPSKKAKVVRGWFH